MAKLGTFHLTISLKTDDEKAKVGADVSLDYMPYKEPEEGPIPMDMKDELMDHDEFIVSGRNAFSKIAKRLREFMSDNWPELE